MGIKILIVQNNMHKEKLSTIAMMFALLLTCSLISCDNKNNTSQTSSTHVHDYSDVWNHDETQHWHTCKDSSCGEKKDVSNHTFNWSEKTPAGVHKDKVEKGVCSVCNYETTRTIKETAIHSYDTSKWMYDENSHWHVSNCDELAPTHDVLKIDEANHSGEWTTTKPEGYGVVGEKKFICTVCGYSYTEEIPALDAKNNTISFANDLVTEKTYDGLAFTIDHAKVNRQGDGEIIITYKGENDTAFSTTAPINVGEYTMKATVKDTAEWKGGEITTTIIINKREVTLPADVFERKFGENLASGKFGLVCINVAEETNNVVEWVTIGAPEAYYAVGMYTISTNELTVDNDNFELNKGAYGTVRFTVRNAPDSFYAGIQDLFTLSGTGDVIITTKIANGTVNTGDQLLVNETGKIITVKKIEKGKGTSAIVVETATAGDEVGFRIEGAKRDELNRGYMLSKPDTIVGYSKVTVTIRSYTKDEGNHAPIANGNKVVAFGDTFGEITGEVTLPEGTDMIIPGEMLEGVTISFQGKKVPAFIGRRFTLKSSARTIAECIITAVPQATRVRSGRMFGIEGKEFIEPIELGEKTFAVNLNRSDISDTLKNAKDTDEITIDFYAIGKTIAKYKRVPGKGEVAYNEVGGKIVGSYLIVDLFTNAGAGELAYYTGEWIYTGEDIFIGMNVIVKTGSGN